MSKKWLLVASLLSIPLATAAATDALRNVWDKILYGAGLGFLGIGPDGAVVAFTRLLIWILVFTLFFAVITSLGKASMSFLRRGQAGVVAAVLATMAAVFLPADVLLATGAGWATAIALLLIGGPVIGITLLFWKIPWDGQETKATVLLKLVLAFILLWILVAMKYHVGRIA